MSKQFYFEQFSLAWIRSLNTKKNKQKKNSKLSKPRFNSIWPTDRTLLGATTPGQSGPGSDGNEGLLRILQSSSITGTSPSGCLVSYTGHSLRGGGLTLQQRSNWCILQPLPTGQKIAKISLLEEKSCQKMKVKTFIWNESLKYYSNKKKHFCEIVRIVKKFK